MKNALLSLTALVFAAGTMYATTIDASLVSLSPATGSGASYVVLNNSVVFTGIIRNEGTAPITEMDLSYSNETGVHTDHIANLNIAPGGEYHFTHSSRYTVLTYGSHAIDMQVSVTGDHNTANNSLHTSVEGVAFIPVHHVTVEEATGTWCGWCVRGMVYLDSMHSVHPTDCDLIAVHNSDPMQNSAYNSGVSGLVPGYPSTLINRDVVSDPQYIFPDYANSIGDFGTADLLPIVSYNSSTRHATVDVSATFAVALNGDYRLACVFTEDDVTGTTSGYNQSNYYSGGANGQMEMPGYDFAALPSSVPAAQMAYDFVARNIAGGFNGLAGSLPTSIPINSTQNYTFHYTIPSQYDVTQMKVIILLIDNTTSTKHIMNSASGAVLMGINDPSSSIGAVSLYPNPANDNATIHLNLSQTEDVIISVYDIAGELISAENKGQVAQGEHNFNLGTANLAKGMYMVKVTAGNSEQTIKLLVTH